MNAQALNEIKHFIYGEKVQGLSFQTVNSVVKSTLTPVLNIQDKRKSLVLIRMNDTSKVKSVLRRLEFANADIFSFCENEDLANFPNPVKNDVYNDLEFVIVVASRYCSCIMWFNDGLNLNESCQSYIVLNSRNIRDILKFISSNSNLDFTSYWDKLTPERRANENLNDAINSIITMINTANNELMVNTIENSQLGDLEKKISTFKESIHEVNNYISIINLNSQILLKRLENETCEKQGTLNDYTYNNLSTIKKAANDMIVLLEKIKNESDINLKEHNLYNFVHEIVDFMGNKFDDNNISINIDIDKNKIAVFDELLTKNVMYNLLNNSIDSLENKDNKKISITYNENNNMVLLNVKNNGEIINEEDFEKIFIKGYTTKKQGSGLGLAVSRENMQKQNGDLRIVKSNNDETVFELELMK